MSQVTCTQCARPFRVSAYRASTARFCSTACKYAGLAIERSRPLIDRFWEKVDRREPNECWPWTAATTFGGYGVIGEFGKHGRLLRASRLSYEIAYGPLPHGQIVRHSCDNPKCVNPAHLVAGTMKDNTADMLKRGRANKRTKISDHHVKSIRQATGTTRAIAAQFEVSQAMVSMIKSGKRRTQV